MGAGRPHENSALIFWLFWHTITQLDRMGVAAEGSGPAAFVCYSRNGGRVIAEPSIPRALIRAVNHFRPRNRRPA
jgi:hypothetical protein